MLVDSCQLPSSWWFGARWFGAVLGEWFPRHPLQEPGKTKSKPPIQNHHEGLPDDSSSWFWVAGASITVPWFGVDKAYPKQMVQFLWLLVVVVFDFSEDYLGFLVVNSPEVDFYSGLSIGDINHPVQIYEVLQKWLRLKLPHQADTETHVLN